MMAGSQKLVLLVDDDVNDVRLTLMAIGDGSYPPTVVVAQDGAAALDYLYCRGQYQQRAAGDPILILLDLKMPKVDGLEVLRQIRATENLRAIPVVILSSSREFKDVLRCYQFGANAYVVKPMDLSGFRAALKDIGSFWLERNEPPPTPR